MANLGFVGLGVMGSQMVSRLLDDVRKAAHGSDNVLYPLREALAHCVPGFAARPLLESAVADGGVPL